MTQVPLIGVSTSITIEKVPERAYVNSAYLHAIEQAGGVPVPLPPQLSPRGIEVLARELHGLLLTGGGDVDPARFGEAPHGSLYDVAPARDALEATAVAIALGRGLPILAICRGIQMLNVALGGTLHQDVGTDPGTQLCHSQEGPRDQPSHKVTVLSGTRLARILGTEELEVNSMHHQAVRVLGRGLVPVAWAPDRIIEGVESEDPASFVLGVQWHPEELVSHSDAARRLFSALVEAARA
jgi:putative glutamine amidotransferase